MVIIPVFTRECWLLVALPALLPEFSFSVSLSLLLSSLSLSPRPARTPSLSLTSAAAHTTTSTCHSGAARHGVRWGVAACTEAGRGGAWSGVAPESNGPRLINPRGVCSGVPTRDNAMMVQVDVLCKDQVASLGAAPLPHERTAARVTDTSVSPRQPRRGNGVRKENRNLNFKRKSIPSQLTAVILNVSLCGSGSAGHSATKTRRAHGTWRLHRKAGKFLFF